MEQWGDFQSEDLDANLKASLGEIFSLPSANNVEDCKKQ